MSRAERHEGGLASGQSGKGLLHALLRCSALLVILISCGTSAYASEESSAQAAPQVEAPSDEEQNAFLTFLYGKTPKDGIVFLPYGMHTQTKSKKIAHNNLIGVVYDSFSAGTFINSFNDRTWYLVLIRNIYASHGFGIDYFAGALYGYKGKLATVRGVPFRNSFLFKHNLNPVISVDGWYEFSDHLQMQVMLTPLVVLGGVKYNF
ncbi:MAG TPA: hypothetical protein VNI58_02445 [Mariprofundaceae bacterium]|nr:hypothetical protein [Mariprofundaceae bacterium]